MPAKYRVAVIGRTNKGNYGHGIDTVWLELPQTQIVAVADDDPTGLAAATKRLKIDRQLVVPILSARREQALVRSIIDIARSLNIETVAEGVETMAHAEMLGILGCDVLQGYAFARPLSSEKFLAFATERGLRLAS